MRKPLFPAILQISALLLSLMLGGGAAYAQTPNSNAKVALAQASDQA